MEVGRDELLVFYDRYLQRCNEHRFDELGEFVADEVNGSEKGLKNYVAGLHAVVEGFPDYQWDLQRLLIDGDWLAARLYGTGTHTGPFRGIRGHRASYPYAGTGDLSDSKRQNRRMLG